MFSVSVQLIPTESSAFIENTIILDLLYTRSVLKALYEVGNAIPFFINNRETDNPIFFLTGTLGTASINPTLNQDVR